MPSIVKEFRDFTINALSFGLGKIADKFSIPGKVTVWDGNIASHKFAKQIIAKLKVLKSNPESKTEAANKKTN